MNTATEKINILHCITACPAIMVPKLTQKELLLALCELINSYKKKKIELYELLHVVSMINTFMGSEQELVKSIIAELVSLSEKQVVSQKEVNKVLKKVQQMISEMN